MGENHLMKKRTPLDTDFVLSKNRIIKILSVRISVHLWLKKELFHEYE